MPVRLGARHGSAAAVETVVRQHLLDRLDMRRGREGAEAPARRRQHHQPKQHDKQKDATHIGPRMCRRRRHLAAPFGSVLASGVMTSNSALPDAIAMPPALPDSLGRAQHRAGRPDGRRQDLDRPAPGGAPRPAVPRRRCRDRAGRRLHHPGVVRPLRRARIPRRRAPGDPPAAGRRRRMVLATGGGAFMDPETRAAIRASAVSRLAALPAADAGAPRRRAHPPAAAAATATRRTCWPADGRPPSDLCRGRPGGGLRRRESGHDHRPRAATALAAHGARRGGCRCACSAAPTTWWSATACSPAPARCWRRCCRRSAPSW